MNWKGGFYKIIYFYGGENKMQGGEVTQPMSNDQLSSRVVETKSRDQKSLILSLTPIIKIWAFQLKPPKIIFSTWKKEHILLI